MADYRVAFILEQNLGHITFAQNLRRNAAADPELRPTWFPLEFSTHSLMSRLPSVGRNWSVRASYAARRILTRAGAPAAFDAIFFHTQVTALFSAHLLRWGGGVISLDATPLNYDSFGAAYGHTRGPEAVEQAKYLLNRRAFRAARRLTTWSDWARTSLIHDYGVPGHRITTVPPGTNLDVWRHAAYTREGNGKVQLLFVGGDFQRKGGDLLLDVFQHRLVDTCELDLVTNAPIESIPQGVRVHRGLTPNSKPLRRLFTSADIFVLPTRADCLAMVIMEAMAASLPVITTSVGALPEAVEHGVNGLVVAADNGTDLADAILSLVADPDRRQQMGMAGRLLAEERFDARVSAGKLLHIVKEAAGQHRTRAVG